MPTKTKTQQESKRSNPERNYVLFFFSFSLYLFCFLFFFLAQQKQLQLQSGGSNKSKVVSILSESLRWWVVHLYRKVWSIAPVFYLTLFSIRPFFPFLLRFFAFSIFFILWKKKSVLDFGLEGFVILFPSLPRQLFFHNVSLGFGFCFFFFIFFLYVAYQLGYYSQYSLSYF